MRITIEKSTDGQLVFVTLISGSNVVTMPADPSQLRNIADLIAVAEKADKFKVTLEVDD